jgi:hypothetical protein
MSGQPPRKGLTLPHVSQRYDFPKILGISRILLCYSSTVLHNGPSKKICVLRGHTWPLSVL